MLYLMQHGKNVPEEENEDKPLSDEGKKETQAAADFISKRQIKVDFIWHSKKLRAVETAKIILSAVSEAQLIEKDNINPTDPVREIPGIIEAAEKDILIVGHLPFLQKLLSLLLAGDDNKQIHNFKNSGLLCLDKKGAWALQWAIIPAIL